MLIYNGTCFHGLSEVNSVELPKHISRKKIVFTAKLAMFVDGPHPFRSFILLPCYAFRLANKSVNEHEN